MTNSDLRGNQRTSGEVSRREGGKIFGSGARTPIAIAILIKNSAHVGPVDLQYRDIGDYLTREQKLDILENEQSLEGTDWATLTPNSHGDWINHRDDRYDTFQPIGDKATKGKPTTPGIFENYSSGLKTNRDAWCYNFSRDAVQANMRRMIANYESQRESGSIQPNNDPTKISWNRALLADLKKGRPHAFDETSVISSAYRPYTRQTAYFNREMNDMIYQLPKFFPSPALLNLVITFPGPGAAAGFSTLIYSELPSLGAATGLQVMALYSYEPIPEGELAVPAPGEVVLDGYRRRDNITDATLTAYRGFYDDAEIGKEDIFFYVYGILHSPEYKETYKADLMKMLPRIPKVKDFWGFSGAGRRLADLHLNYETVEPYPLEEISSPPADSTEDALYEFYKVTKLSFGARKDRSRIIYNLRITLTGIPEEAFEYQVNGKSALEWIFDRYQVTIHKDSQITNDPNDYSREVGAPRYIIDLIKRIVTVSVETNKIVSALPVLDITE